MACAPAWRGGARPFRTWARTSGSDRLRFGATQHWLSEETRFELELPAHFVAGLRPIANEDTSGLWSVGRQLWVELGRRNGFELPSRLLTEIDEAIAGDR